MSENSKVTSSADGSVNLENAEPGQNGRRLRNPVLDRLQANKHRSISESDAHSQNLLARRNRQEDYGSITPPMEASLMRRVSTSSKLAGEAFFESLREFSSPTMVASYRDSVGALGPPRLEPEAPHAEIIDKHDLVSLLSNQNVGVGEINLAEAGSPERATSSVVAGWNVSNLIQGIGILGLPYACICAGWVSLVMIVLVALICGYTARLIGKCLYDRVDEIDPALVEFYRNSDSVPTVRTRKTYACIAAKVWPKAGRKIVSMVVVTELFGAMVLYLILLGNSLKTLLDHATGHELAFSVYTACFGYALLPFILVPRMRIIAWFSVVACVGLFCTVAMVIVYTLIMAPSGHMSWSNLPAPNLKTIPVSIGIIVFSYCAHPVLPGIEGSMRKPQQYKVMIEVSFAAAMLVKILVGLLPAMLFGSNTKQVVVDNMESHPRFALALHFMVALNVFFSMPLVVYVIGEQLDAAILPHFQGNLCDPQMGGRLYPMWLTVNRVILLSFSLLVAIGVPHFALIMGLIGSITGSCLCFIFPAYFHYKMHRCKLVLWQILVRILIIIFGCFTLIFGVTFSAIRLKKAIVDGEETFAF